MFLNSNRSINTDNSTLALDKKPINSSEPKLVDQESLSDLMFDTTYIEKTKESLLNFYCDYIKTPFSVEKILMRLILFFKVNKYGEKVRKSLSQTNPEVMKLVENSLTESDIKEFEDKLIEEKFMEIEEYAELLKDLRYSLLLKDLRSSVTNNLYIFPTEILEACIRTLKSLRVIDVECMKRLVKEISPATDSIRGRDIKMPIGPPGCGKSALIHILGGSKMGRVVDKNGIPTNYYEPKEITNPYLREVRCTHNMICEMTPITPVIVNLKNSTFLMEEKS